MCWSCSIIANRCNWEIAKTFRLDRLDRGEHVVAIDAGLAVALQHMAQLFGGRQPPGILHMAAIDHVDERADALAVVLGPIPIVSPPGRPR